MVYSVRRERGEQKLWTIQLVWDKTINIFSSFNIQRNVFQHLSFTFFLNFPQRAFFGKASLVLQLNPGTFLFGFHIYLIILFSAYQKATLALRVRNMLNVRIKLSWRDSSLNLFVYKNANSLLCNISFLPWQHLGHFFS